MEAKPRPENIYIKKTRSLARIDEHKAKIPDCVLIFMLQKSETLLNKLLFQNAQQVYQSEAEQGMTITFVQYHFPRCNAAVIIADEIISKMKEEEDKRGRTFHGNISQANT